MKSVLYVERKFTGFFSLEKIFRQIAKELPESEFTSAFQQAEHGSGLINILKNLLSFRSQPADVYHVTGDITYVALKLPGDRTVLTIPDLSILKYRTGIRRLVLKKLLFEWPIRRSRYVTAISNATREDILKEIGCDPEKVRTVELPVDDSLTPGEKPPFNLHRPNILQVGALRYKNVPNLIRALEGLNCRLTIIGKLDDEIQAMLNEKKIDYRNVFGLDDDAVREEYLAADIVTFCSVYEGFGLPIIEAQAMRTPVITSNMEPMRSVAGSGAILVDPLDVDSIRRAIESLIGDEKLRSELVKRGTENVKRFSPDVIAEKYAELYTEVAEGSAPGQ